MLKYQDSKISLERFHYIENLLNTEVVDSITRALKVFSSIPYFYIKNNTLYFKVRSLEFAVVNEGLDSWVNPNVLHELFSIKTDIICDTLEQAKKIKADFRVPGFHTLALMEGTKVSLILSINTKQDIFGATLLGALDSYLAQCFGENLTL